MTDSPARIRDSADQGASEEAFDVAGSWRELLSREYAGAVVVLAGGVALYAMNLYFTAALMPSIVDDIGGERFYAWVSTGFLMAAVIASMLVGRTLAARGATGAYLVGFTVFAAGAAVNAVSPTIGVLVVGRVVQGLGGGLLAGLGYAVIRGALPSHLWTRAAGVVSAMWGVGTLAGPTLGGLFAELGAWRWAYVLLLVAALGLAALTRRTLAGRSPASDDVVPVPVPSLALLTLAAAAFGISSSVPRGWATAAAIAAGVLLLVFFFAAERRGAASVLPRMTYLPGNRLKWVYLTVAALCAGVMTENYIPLFGQELGGLPPLSAGLLGAAVSAGWSTAQTFSVGFGPARTRVAIQAAPVVVTAGLAGYALLQSDAPSTARLIAWAAALFVAGMGIGAAFPHLTVAAMSSTTDEAEGAKAAAALNTTEMIAFSVSSAIAGTLVALGGESTLASARWMTFGIAVITAAGTAAAVMTVRDAEPPR